MRHSRDLISIAYYLLFSLFSTFRFGSRPAIIFPSLVLSNRRIHVSWPDLRHSFGFILGKRGRSSSTSLTTRAHSFEAACSRNLRNHSVLVKAELHIRDSLSELPCMDSSFSTDSLPSIYPSKHPSFPAAADFDLGIGNLPPVLALILQEGRNLSSHRISVNPGKGRRI